MTKSPEISFTNPSEHFKSLVWAANNNLNLTLPDRSIIITNNNHTINLNHNQHHYRIQNQNNNNDNYQNIRNNEFNMNQDFDEKKKNNNKRLDLFCASSPVRVTRSCWSESKKSHCGMSTMSLAGGAIKESLEIGLMENCSDPRSADAEKSQEQSKRAALSESQPASQSTSSATSKTSLASTTSNQSISSSSSSSISSISSISSTSSTSSASSISSLEASHHSSASSRSEREHSRLENGGQKSERSPSIRSVAQFQQRVEPMIVISTPPIEWARASGCPLPARVRHYSAPLNASPCANRGSMSRLRQLQVSLVFCLLVVSAGPTLKAAFGAPTPANTLEQQNSLANHLKLKRTDTNHWTEQQAGDNSKHLLSTTKSTNSEKSQQQNNNDISPSTTTSAKYPNSQVPTTTNLKRTELGSKLSEVQADGLSPRKSPNEQGAASDGDLRLAGGDGTVRSSRIKRTGTSDQRLADYEVQLMRRDRERARVAAAVAARAAVAASAAASASSAAPPTAS